MTCAPNKNSDQPTHLHSLISLHCLHEETLGSWLRIERHVKTEQTVQVPKYESSLGTHHFVGFVALQLKLFQLETNFHINFTQC